MDVHEWSALVNLEKDYLTQSMCYHKAQYCWSKNYNGAHSEGLLVCL